MSERLRRGLVEQGWLLGAVALLAYLGLAPAHVVAGDNAEFAALGAVGGRAHPSGYPLYVLLLRATAWLPAASEAHRASLVTAALAAAQVVTLHAACRAWGARAGAAGLAVATFAAAPLVLRVHTEADVFALNSLVAAAVLWLAGAGGPRRGLARCGALGLVAGLGLANNLTCVLLMPVGLHGVVRGVAEARADGGARPAIAWARGLGAALVGLAAGLAPYAYLWLAPDAVGFSQPVRGLGDLLDVFLRRDYGTWTHRRGTGADVRASASLLGHAALVGRTWLWGLAPVGLGALAAACARGAERAAWRALAVAWLLAGPLLAWRLEVEPHGVGGYIGGRMQLMSASLLALPVARGLGALGTRWRRAPTPAVAAAAAAGGFLALTAASLPWLARVHARAVEAGARNLLETLPPRALVLVVSDDQCFASRYLQLAEGVRGDVDVVCWLLVDRAWYRAQLAPRGVALGAWSTAPATVAAGEALLATGRPLLVDGYQATLLAGLPTYPHGVLRRVLPRGGATPSVAEVTARQRELYARFDLDYPRPRREDDFAATAHRRYAAPWRELAGVLAAAGDRGGAEDALALARALGPE